MAIWDELDNPYVWANPGAALSYEGLSGMGGGGGLTGGVSALGKGAKDLWNTVKDVNRNEFSADFLKPPSELESTLKNWALTGEGPSAAQGLIAAERAKNIAAAQSMAKSQQGLTTGAQQRLATMGSAHANAAAAKQGAELRSREQQQALGGYQDLYKTQAQAYADAMRANAQVAAENTAADRNLVSGIVNMGAGLIGF